jgi:hypothetical protein
MAAATERIAGRIADSSKSIRSLLILKGEIKMHGAKMKNTVRKKTHQFTRA